MHVARGAVGVEFDIEHALGDDAAITRACEARILNRMFEIEQHTRLGPVSRSSTSTAPRFKRSRWRSRVRSMTESSSG